MRPASRPFRHAQHPRRHRRRHHRRPRDLRRPGRRRRPRGLATALSAARHGARVLVVDRRPGMSGLPRATGINVRTVEILRTWGIARAVRPTASPSYPTPPRRPPSSRPRIRSAGSGGYPSLREILDVSPVLPLACPQDRLEPVLVDAVRQAGGEIRFEHPADGPRPSGPTACTPGSSARARGCTPGSWSVRTARAAPCAPRSASPPRAPGHLGARRPGALPARSPPLPGAAPPLLTFVDVPDRAALAPMGDHRWAYVGLSFDGTARPDVPDRLDADPAGRARRPPDLAPEVLDVQRDHLGGRGRDNLPAPGRGSSSATPRTGPPPSPGSA